MAVTFGFYNAVNNDRKYDAVQMASIFDGIILDGILSTIGNRFVVTATGGMGITVGSGRAWFDRTWTYNDSDLATNVKNSEVLLNRIDAMVLEVNIHDEGRINSIKWVYGTPASIPVRPELIKEEYINQYPLAYVYVAQGTTVISQANIENMIGTDETPFVTGPLQTISASILLAQWSTQWLELLAAMTNQKGDQQIDWKEQTEKQQADFDALLALLGLQKIKQQSDWQEQTDQQQTDFDSLLQLLGLQKIKQQSDWEQQTDKQQIDFETMQAVWGAWIGGAISDPANYFQRNFDNPSMYIGSTRWKTQLDTNTILEEIRGGRLEDGPVAASRKTIRRSNGADVEYIFHDLLNGTIISHFIEHFDRVTSRKVRNWMEGVV